MAKRVSVADPSESRHCSCTVTFALRRPKPSTFQGYGAADAGTASGSTRAFHSCAPKVNRGLPARVSALFLRGVV